MNVAELRRTLARQSCHSGTVISGEKLLQQGRELQRIYREAHLEIVSPRWRAAAAILHDGQRVR